MHDIQHPIQYSRDEKFHSCKWHKNRNLRSYPCYLGVELWHRWSIQTTDVWLPEHLYLREKGQTYPCLLRLICFAFFFFFGFVFNRCCCSVLVPSDPFFMAGKIPGYKMLVAMFMCYLHLLYFWIWGLQVDSSLCQEHCKSLWFHVTLAHFGKSAWERTFVRHWLHQATYLF